MSQKWDKNKRRGDESLNCKHRAKYRKIVAEAEDSFDESVVSNAFVEDATTAVDTNKAPSLSTPRFRAVRPHFRTHTDNAARTNAASTEEPLPRTELAFVGDQAEEAALVAENEIATTTDPDGRPFHSPAHVTEPSLLVVQPVKATSSTNDFMSFKPVSNTPAVSAFVAHPSASETLTATEPTSITSKKGSSPTDDAIRKQSRIPSAAVIGHNAETGSPVYLFGSKSITSRITASRPASTVEIGDTIDAGDSGSSQSNSRARKRKSKSVAKAKAPVRKSATKATITAASKSCTISAIKSTSNPTAIKETSSASTATAPTPVSPTATASTTLSYVSPYLPNSTERLPLVFPLLALTKKTEARRKAERRHRQAQREKELNDARKVWKP